jgi:hypothetical protein
MNWFAKRYTHIIIIGNGFDLNLGLKTSYTDFISSEHFNNQVNNGNDLCHYLQEQHNLKRWIDIENELKAYSNMNAENFEEDFDNLCSALMEHLKDLNYDEINWDSHAYNLIKQIRSQEFLILDFNYTKSIYKLLVDLSYPTSLIKERIVKVHGSIESGNIIFGVEDQARIHRQDIFLKKTCNINYAPIPFRQLLENASEVHIFGHSLGETDHMYFFDFFSGCTNRRASNDMGSIFLYYFGKTGYKELHMQLDDLTIKRIGFLKQNTKFNQIDVSKPK